MVNMQHLTADKIDSIIDFLEHVPAKFYGGYPSIITSLASLINDRGITINNAPSVIFTGAEKLYDFQKQEITTAFPGVKLVEHYGFSEQAGAASKATDGYYHEDFELGHFELKNPQRVENGYSGSLLATGLHNYGMPFIRYEMGDSGIFADDSVKGSVNSQIFLDIQGRTEDYIITPEGAKISRCDYLLKETTKIKECQVVQNRLGEMTFKIVRRPGYNKADEDNIMMYVRQLISPTIKVYFEYVDEIPRTKAGKFKAVVSNLNKTNNRATVNQHFVEV